MGSGRSALPEQKDAADDKCQQCRGSSIAAHSETTSAHRFVEEIADNRPQRPGQYKRGPEEHRARYPGPEIRSDDDSEQGGENESAARVPKPCCIGCPVSQRGAERLGKHDGYPIKQLSLG